MAKKATNIPDMSKDFLISFFLPEGMTDWFDVVKVEEKTNE